MRTQDGTELAATCKKEFLRWTLEREREPGGVKRLFFELATGKCKESPYAGALERAREEADACLMRQGRYPKRRENDVGSEINFRRLAAMASATEDEDFSYLEQVAEEGVPLGVGQELPRTPLVFEEKTSWARDHIEEALQQKWADNYESAEENAEDIARQIREDLVTEEEAKKRFGDRLAVAALGAVPKELGSSTVRLIHDGSYSVQVNGRIKVRDRMRFPLS